MKKETNLSPAQGLKLRSLQEILTSLEQRICKKKSGGEGTLGEADTTAMAQDMQKSPELKRPFRSKTRGRASTSLIERAQLSLFELEQQGQFTKYPIYPESEFPTFLTRLSIFVPAKRSHQREIIDQENALPFSTPWGEGKKHGPPLTVYDEDTLIAIGRLRQNLLVGKPENMPVPVSDLYRSSKQSTIHVHVVQCMLSDIQNVCGTSRGGRNNQMRLDSVKRLGATVIEFSTKTAEKFMGRGTEIKLIDVAWQEYEDNAILYIQFTPVMAKWFEKEYTYIDWNMRKQLTDTGKAVHRFLSSQPKEYEIYTKKLMATLGYIRNHNKFLVDLREAMDQLLTLGWISNYSIEGTGRRLPYKLVLKRKLSKEIKS